MQSFPVMVRGLLLLLGVMTSPLPSIPPQGAASSAGREAFIRSHRPFRLTGVTVEGTTVNLSFYLGHWYSQNLKEYDLADIVDTVRVYRRQVDCHWSWDRDDILDGIICTLGPDDIIYEGPLQPITGKTYRYADATAKVGGVYAYYVAGARGPITGPVAVKVRDPQVWWSQEKIAAELAQLEKDHPQLVQVARIGRTPRGRDILGVTVGTGSARMALIGAVHASESGPELIIPFLQQAAAEHADLLTEVSLVAVPCVNVDERERAATGYPFYLRRNTVDVDLNRNFPADWEEVSFMYGASSAERNSGTYRGPTPASEPETQAVVTFLRANPPDVIFSYHHLACVTGKSLWAPRAAGNDAAYRKECRAIYEAYNAGYSSVLGGLPASSDDNFLHFGATSGSLPLFGYREFHAPAYDVERHWKNDGLDYSGLDQTTVETLRLNQQQHAAALRNVMKLLAGRADASCPLR